ncbi:hypothetical protein GCM10023196_030640 [Actinoallomurus vinaceus]|uniref:HIT domain-containing protein n=1 Tax=Actinoallomurus vinaceus TaxID=1080074 RepID=A0ABP8U9B6_9ACTN
MSFDEAAYTARIHGDNEAGRCFICRIVAGQHPPEDIVVLRDEVCVAFLALPYRLHGYTLIAPLEHRRDVVADFTPGQYLGLQSRIHRLGRAISAVVPTERLYVFSFGSHQGVDHVHWHLAPLPPGVPFDQQQFAAVDGTPQVDVSHEQKTDLARRIAESYTTTGPRSRRGEPSDTGTARPRPAQNQVVEIGASRVSRMRRWLRPRDTSGHDGPREQGGGRPCSRMRSPRS